MDEAGSHGKPFGRHPLNRVIVRSQGDNRHMDTFGLVGFTFGLMGFVVSISVMGQLSEVKKDVENLKLQVGPQR